MYALYRKGRTHWVGDVQCEIVRVELSEIDKYREEGWVDDINDLVPYLKSVEKSKTDLPVKK
jgi:hypothetical protein